MAVAKLVLLLGPVAAAALAMFAVRVLDEHDRDINDRNAW